MSLKNQKKKIKTKAERNWSSKLSRESFLTHMKYQICTAACCTLWEYSWARKESSILKRISIFVIMLRAGGVRVCVLSLEQTLDFHRRICLPSFGQANWWAVDRPRKPVSMQVEGDFSLRWAEEEMGSLPIAAGNQTASPTWQVASTRMPIKIKTTLWSSELEALERGKTSLFEFFQLSTNWRLSPTVINTLPNSTSKQAAGLPCSE